MGKSKKKKDDYSESSDSDSSSESSSSPEPKKHKKKKSHKKKSTKKHKKQESDSSDQSPSSDSSDNQYSRTKHAKKKHKKSKHHDVPAKIMDDEPAAVELPKPKSKSKWEHSDEEDDHKTYEHIRPRSGSRRREAVDRHPSDRRGYSRERYDYRGGRDNAPPPHRRDYRDHPPESQYRRQERSRSREKYRPRPDERRDDYRSRPYPSSYNDRDRNGSRGDYRPNESRDRDRDRGNNRERHQNDRQRNQGRSQSPGNERAARSVSPRRPRNFPRRSSADEGDKKYDWGKKSDRPAEDEGDKEPPEKQKPDFGLSGKLAEDTNKVHGIVIKYAEPPEARRPKRRWRLYPFKGEQTLPTLYIHRQSCYLIGRDRKICDLPVDHPSCSKQHAVLQYRLVPFERNDGTQGKRVRPYIIDLESSNGTFVNNQKIDSKKYVELLEKDVVKFGFSSREYVMLHENSKDEADDDDVLELETEPAVAVKPEPA